MSCVSGPPRGPTTVVAVRNDEILAVGDSILETPRSWAWRLAESTDSALIVRATGGARVGDVLDRQLDGLDPADRYRLACLTIGTNDVADDDWSLEAYLDELDQVLEQVRAGAERVVLTTMSLALRQPPTSRAATMRVRVENLNRAFARLDDVLVVSAAGLRSRLHLEPDYIHFNDAGHALLADRAAAMLDVTPPPSALHPGRPPLPRAKFVFLAVTDAARRKMG